MKESEGLYRSFRFLKKALLGIAVVLVSLLLFGYFFFMRHVDAPKAWTAADRELRGGMLQYGEKVERRAQVYMRRPSDYYRGANPVQRRLEDSHPTGRWRLYRPPHRHVRKGISGP